jgi:DNA-3-methyladenine glycosylase I
VTGAIEGHDGLGRCPWGLSPPEYQQYHDLEWGRPVGDDRAILEKICLEGFQSGLSWLTVLRKRAAFRAAFAGFDAQTVARYGEDDISRLLADAGIIRHRQKIEAVVANARAVVGLWSEGLSLAGLLWAHEPSPAAPPSDTSEIAASTPGSQSLSAALRGYGFRFVGPTTLYAAMQSLGVVNDHLAGCHFRDVCETARAGFRRPAEGAGPVATRLRPSRRKG